VRSYTAALGVGGNTAVYSSVRRAFEVVGRQAGDGYLTSIVLMSDGENNRGIPLFESYLNLPGWFAAGRGAGERRTAADELSAQLGLIADQVRHTAERVYETNSQRLRDQTRYLEERGRSSDLDLPASHDSTTPDPATPDPTVP
jgi:hypothetical protein